MTEKFIFFKVCSRIVIFLRVGHSKKTKKTDNFLLFNKNLLHNELPEVFLYFRNLFQFKLDFYCVEKRHTVIIALLFLILK